MNHQLLSATLATLFLASACGSEPVVTNVEQTDSITLEDNTVDGLIGGDELLALFEPAGDSLFVTTTLDEGVSMDSFDFSGTPIPGSLAHFFDGIQYYGTFDQATDLYATRSMELGDRYVALFVRVPGTHWSSRVNAFVFDREDQRLTGSVLEIAESTDDGGSYFTRDGNVVRVADNLALMITLQESSCEMAGGNPTPDCTDSLKSWVYTLDSGFEYLAGASR